MSAPSKQLNQRKRSAKRKVVCIVEMQKKRAAFPLRRLYDIGMDHGQEIYFSIHILPQLKKIADNPLVDLQVFSMDSKSEFLLQKNKIKHESLAYISENAFNKRNLIKAGSEILKLSSLMSKHKVLHEFEGVDLMDMALFDVNLRHYNFITGFVDAMRSILNRVQVDEIIVWNRNAFFQSLLTEIAQTQKIPLEDRTQLFHRAASRVKQRVIGRMARFTVPVFLRNLSISGTDHSHNRRRASKIKKLKQIIISHIDVPAYKLVPMAKALSKNYDVMFLIQNQQDTAEFESSGLRVQKLQDYIDEAVAGKLMGFRRRLAAVHFPAGFRENLKYSGINIFPAMKELFSFLYCGRFYELASYKAILDRVIAKEKPVLFITSEEVSKFGKVLVETAHRNGVPSVVMQHGDICRVPLKEGTKAAKFLCYGEWAKKIQITHGVPEDRLAIVGLPEMQKKANPLKEEVYSHFKIPAGKKIFLVATQGIPDSVNYPFFDVVFRAMPEFPNLHFIIKMHPDETSYLHDKFIDKYNVKNATLVRHGEFPLEKLLCSCHCLINFYSAVGVEALVKGKYLLSVNANSLPENMFPEQEKNAVITACSYEETLDGIKAISTLALNEAFVKRISRKYVWAQGEDACNNIVSEVGKIIG